MLPPRTDETGGSDPFVVAHVETSGRSTTAFVVGYTKARVDWLLVHIRQYPRGAY